MKVLKCVACPKVHWTRLEDGGRCHKHRAKTKRRPPRISSGHRRVKKAFVPQEKKKKRGEK